MPRSRPDGTLSALPCFYPPCQASGLSLRPFTRTSNGCGAKFGLTNYVCTKLTTKSGALSSGAALMSAGDVLSAAMEPSG